MSLAQQLLVGVVKAYRLFLSPWLGSACRFEPTCSVYSIEALETHGAAKGSYLTLKRLGRCHPWCEGGLDPVPAKTPKKAQALEKATLFTHLSPNQSSNLVKKPS
jgi:putative membrane protein insertion efficiency factor